MQVPQNAMFHRHLVLAYAFTWALQLAYLAFVGLRWWRIRRGPGL